MMVLVTALLAVWLACTVVRQLRLGPWQCTARIAEWIERHDACRVVPSFLFFAPTPPSLDFELLYRDRLPDGSTTHWRAIGLVTRSPWRPVLNPQKRRYQAAFRMCTVLLRDVRVQVCAQKRLDMLCETDAYLGLAGVVTAAPHSVASDRTQFMIAVHAGYDGRRAAAPAFISPYFHV
jgi:hypothetical protein